MNTSWTRTLAPSLAPFDVTAAKLQLRLNASDTTEDTLVTRMVSGAVADVENYLGRGLLTQSWKYTQDLWAEVTALPFAAPLQTASVVVKYYDESGVLQTLSSSVYLVDAVAEPAVIRRKPNQVWPALQLDRPNAIEITYDVGWTAAASIPANILDGVYLLLTKRYVCRGDEAPEAGAGALGCPAAEARLAASRVFWYPPQGVCA